MLFLAALTAPGVDMLLRDASARGPEVEGRATRPAPEWKTEPRAMLRYPAAFEAHFNDTLGLRDVLLRLNSRRALDVFHTSPSNDVHIGKDGWLFYSGFRSFETFRGLTRMSPADLADWQHALEARRDFVESLGAVHIFAFGPNKETIYPEYMPPGLEPLGPTRLDQFTEWMAAHSDVELVDLRPGLRAARQQDRPGSYLYFEEGTHWNGRGCMVAIRELKRAADAHFPEVAASPLPNWFIHPDAYPESWRTKMYLDIPANRTRETWIADAAQLHAVVANTNDPRGLSYIRRDSDLPTLVMLHDSFGPTVLQILAEHFSRSRSRDVHQIDPDELIRDPPDVVIELTVERTLIAGRPAGMEPVPAHAIVALNADHGRQLQARRFAASTDVRFWLDLENAPTQCRTTGNLRVTVDTGAHGPELLLERHSAIDSLILPPIPPSTPSDLLLLVEITSPSPTSADIFFQSRGRTDWPSDQGVTIPLVAGANRYWVPLHKSYDVEHVRIRPGRADGDRCSLTRLEVRGVARP